MNTPQNTGPTQSTQIQPVVPAGTAIRRILSLSAGLALLSSASLQAQTFTPIPLTPASFTVNTVIPVDWPHRLNNQTVSVTIDHGPCLQTNNPAGWQTYYSIAAGDTFFEQGMNRAHTTYGLPAGGTLLTNTTTGAAFLHYFQLPYWTNWNSNCICLCPYTNSYIYNNVSLVGGPYTYPVNNPYYNPSLTLNNTNGLGGFNTNKYTALSFLCTGGGPDTDTVTIQYADGTSQGPVTFSVPNWFNANAIVPISGSPSNTFAYTAQCRGQPAESKNVFTDNSGATTGSRLWSFDIALKSGAAAPTNLIFQVGSAFVNSGAASSANHADVIIAVSASANSADNATVPNTGTLTGPFIPNPVSGYNAGFVVANTPQTAAALAPLNATMDNGTNFLAGGGNTWLEVGWDTAAPTNGFPAHGSILTSLANPTRTYQMPASYHQNSSALINTNTQLASLTPQTPGTFTAFSLLTCGASIGAGKVMTNYIVLEHSDGINESNLFYCYDWFETTVPYAYATGERANIGNTGSTAGVYVGTLDATGTSFGVPRIFESEFQTQDGSSVTNIVLGYVLAPAANAASYVIAVSGSTNFLPVQVPIAYTPAQNVFAGQTASFQITPGIGSLPQFQWQYSDGASFTNNLPNGASVVPGSAATISGATTTNLTIAGVSAADAAYFYTCQVYNSAPSSTNGPLEVLSLRVSTNPNIASPGDVISDFGETTLLSPTGLGVTNVIDGSLSAYLNYGPTANTAGPFTGPVGFILTPYAGSTVVNALVFYTAVNASVADPADFMLEGSNDGGTTWATIVADEPLALPVQRNLSTTFPVNITNQVLQEVDFANSTAYTTYRVTVQNVRSNSLANSMQIAEVQFLGVQQPVAPAILLQPTPANKTLLQGGTYTTTSLQASGPTNYYYQWFSVLGGVTNGIANATNASLNLAGVQVSASGTYFCVVSNLYGATASTNLSLTVVAPSSGYASTIVGDGPLAYWRLDEGNGAAATPVSAGTVANDYMGHLNGVYTNANIGEQGYSTNDTDTAAEFGNLIGYTADSFVGQVPAFNNLVAFSNTPAAFSVEAWVQNPNYLIQSIAGAGIVTYGYGGGGEQFALDCGGGTDNSFRFYFRCAVSGTNGSNPSFPVAAPTNYNTGDGLWHHLVGVLNDVTPNVSNNFALLYVDGALVSSVSLGTNLVGVQVGHGPASTSASSAFSIGSRSSANTTNMNDQFSGNIDEVAIYPYALSSNQVLNHYYAAGIAPRITLQPTNLVAAQGGTATFVTAVVGSPALSLQWYETPASTGTTVPLANQTNATLVLSNVVQDVSGPDSYYLEASNIYSVVDSTVVTLTIDAAPNFTQDLPANYTVLVGSTVSLATAVVGSKPISFGWYYDSSTVLQNGGRLSGANTNVLTITNVQPSDAGTYQVFATNTYGTMSSMLATVTVVPAVGFNGFGSGWALAGNGSYSDSNVLTFTTSTGQGTYSFFNQPVYIGNFMASWTYQDIGGGGADGTCFVIQNDSRGTAASGGTGGALGVGGITPSVELEFNIYAGNGIGGVGYAFSSNGITASVTDPFPLNLASGDPIFVTLNYLNGVASLTLTDTNLGTSYNTSVALNLPAAVHGSTAYVGFTGSSGGVGSDQTVSDFNFVSWPALTLQSTTPGSYLFSWPVGVGGYVLQQSTSLTTPNWTTVAGTVTQVGGMNQQAVSASGGQVFYRLANQYTPQ